MSDETTNDETKNDELDLSPREIEPGDLRSRRRLLPMLVLVLAVASIGFVLVRTLGDAALFFYNADEAVERREELIGQRFRVQGTPFGDVTEVDLVDQGDIGVVFPIQFDGTVVDVIHVGSPAELFQPGVPVVLEGTWEAGPAGLLPIDGGADDGWHFKSSDMIVKHDNEYRNDNRERLQDADSGGQTTP